MKTSIRRHGTEVKAHALCRRRGGAPCHGLSCARPFDVLATRRLPAEESPLASLSSEPSEHPEVDHRWCIVARDVPASRGIRHHRPPRPGGREPRRQADGHGAIGGPTEGVRDREVFSPSSPIQRSTSSKPPATLWVNVSHALQAPHRSPYRTPSRPLAGTHSPSGPAELTPTDPTGIAAQSPDSLPRSPRREIDVRAGAGSRPWTSRREIGCWARPGLGHADQSLARGRELRSVQARTCD